MANPREYVEAPPVTPLPFGLLSAALVTDDLTGHRVFGTVYEPAYCGPVFDANGVCEDAPNFGTVSVSVNNARLATLTSAGAPASSGGYTVDWGDGNHTSGLTSPASTHTYAANGTYGVTITDDSGLGYYAFRSITVTNGATSGPFGATASFSKEVVDGIVEADGDPFTLYHLFRCRPVGHSPADIAARAQEAYRLGEPRGIERMFARYLANHDLGVDVTPTPGTAVSPVDGLAILEKYAGANYGGVPVLHSPRDVTALLSAQNVLLRQGTRLETIQGSIVASGGGYNRITGPTNPDTQPAAGKTWLYVSGQVVIRRGEQISVGAVQPTLNEVTALAERPVVVSTECIVAAVLVQTAGA